MIGCITVIAAIRSVGVLLISSLIVIPDLTAIVSRQRLQTNHPNFV